MVSCLWTAPFRPAPLGTSKPSSFGPYHELCGPIDFVNAEQSSVALSATTVGAFFFGDKLVYNSHNYGLW